MRDKDRIDLDSIQIHKKVISDIVSASLSAVDGVRLETEDVRSRLAKLLGQAHHPAITVLVDRENQVNIEVKVYIQYGRNISDLAVSIQDIVRKEIEKAVDINLKDVNVNVQGIERRAE